MTGMATTDRADIVDAVYENLGCSRKDALAIVVAVFETVKATLERGEDVKLPGFGNFVVRSKRSRRGRNPKTGETVEVTARKVLTFKPSQILRHRVLIEMVET